MTRVKVLECFLRDTAEHTIDVLNDDGLYRHLRFSRNGSACYGFNIVTWPGYLAITGDMGDFVFSRTRDMFEFFRDSAAEGGKAMRINPGYWAEKLKAGAGGGVDRAIAKEWSGAAFTAAVEQEFTSWAEGRDDAEAVAELREQINEDVLPYADSEYEAVAAINGFESPHFEFADFWEHSCTDWTTHYLWCCYAIVWAIEKYDAAQQAGRFYLQDSRSYVGNDMLFWAKDGNGYVTDLRKAHVYTREEALRLHRARETDIPWPKAYIDSHRRPTVDMQYVSRDAIKEAGVELVEPRKPKPERFNCHGCGKFISERDVYGDCPHCGADNRP